MKTMDSNKAQDAAKQLIEKLKVTSSIHEPFPNVSEGEWPNIAYVIIFSRNSQRIQTTYHLGVGHVTWPKRYEDIPAGADVPVFNTLRMNPNAQLKNKMEHAIAATLLAKVQKVVPNIYEVLANICREGLEAHRDRFEDWADNLGYDRDSRKAEAIYKQSVNEYYDAVSLLGIDNVEKLAELAANF